jgi:hypothetical protein
VLRADHRRRWSLRGAPLASLAAALAIAGCGSSSHPGTSADPATVVPAAAPVYVGADLRPEGSEQASAQAVGRALTRQQNPYVRLLGALQTPGSAQLRYQQDVAPWLGPHGGAFVSGYSQLGALLPLLQHVLLGTGSASFPYGAGAAQGAIVLDTSDAEKARSFLKQQAARAGAHTAGYRGVSYMATAGGIAFAVVDRFAVLGSETALHGVIDTVQGGPSLANDGTYDQLQAAAPDGVLAHVYVAHPSKAEAGEAAGLAQLLAGGRAVDLSAVPSSSSLALYADASGSGQGGLLASVAGGAQALSALPGDSWLAVGLADAAAAIGRGSSQLGALAGLIGAQPQAGAAGLSLGGIVGGLLGPLQALGRAGEHEPAAFTSWMGSGGVFASGSGLLELKGAVVVESKDPARSHAAVGRLGALLRSAGDSVAPASIPGTDAALSVRVSGLPLALYIANGRSSSGATKFVLGLGEASVHEALEPTTTLAEAQSTATAASVLGEGIKPSLIFQVPALLSILEGVGLSEDPNLAPALPLLRGTSAISGGGRGLGGGIERFKLVLGLNQT